jgi:hypothetical protein
LHARDKSKVTHKIPLQSIFHPRSFLEQQRQLASLDNSDVLLERAINLLSVFQEYMVPVVTIAERDATQVVSIFERINSTGVRLGVVDFMRALTWSDEFDLTSELDGLQSSLEETGFLFEDEALLKALGIILGLRPLPDVLLRLRDIPAGRLHRAVRALRAKLREAVGFVSEELGMASADALPYEAQWLLLITLLNEQVDIARIRRKLRDWFTATSFYEALKGRPDHALVRMIEEIVAQLKEGESIQAPPHDIRSSELVTKRFLRGKATSVAYVQLLIRNGLFSEVPLVNVPYEQFVPIVDRETLSEVFGRDVRSARTIGNILFVPAERRVKGSFLEQATNLDTSFLEAQFVTRRFILQLKKGDVRSALTSRASSIRLAVDLSAEH